MEMPPNEWLVAEFRDYMGKCTRSEVNKQKETAHDGQGLEEVVLHEITLGMGANTRFSRVTTRLLKTY